MKVDPYKHEERYLKWKQEVTANKIKGVSSSNAKVILEYVLDMEAGINISIQSKKGMRSYPRLNNIRQRLLFIVKQLEELYQIEDITKITEREIFRYFGAMATGEIRTQKGAIYKSRCDYVKVFKAFWHWWMKVNFKEGIVVQDITQDLDTTRSKPPWVYLDEEKIKLLANNSKIEYRTLIWFLFDSGIRAPSELMNIRVNDLNAEYSELMVRDEVSKTFGRKIKLMLCSDFLREYIQLKGLKEGDYIFTIDPKNMNRYLKRLSEKLFGDSVSLGGEKFSNLTLYDLRHCSCCFWLNRYKSESALKFRFGWKKSDKIHYYSEFLGMKDNISDEDMLVDLTKTEIEQKLEKSEKKYDILLDKYNHMEEQLNLIYGKTNEIVRSIVDEYMKKEVIVDV
ncbi:hypothetical protein CMI42_05255 [Candidatus Pacearchaeota archaeon]|nr:hypothetical protein [Candidatus Pacearchaeota archaeon]